MSGLMGFSVLGLSAKAPKLNPIKPKPETRNPKFAG